jgi:hypothetical protein
MHMPGKFSEVLWKQLILWGEIQVAIPPWAKQAQKYALFIEMKNCIARKVEDMVLSSN